MNTILSAKLIPLAIAYVTRRMAIGGWLFYYYLNTFIGFFFALSMYWMAFDQGLFQLDGWPNQKIFYLYLFTTTPIMVLYSLRFFISGRLILKSHRNMRNISFLKSIFFYSALLYTISFYIDKTYFEEGSEVIDIIGFFLNILWFFYFSFSRRVKYVFSNPYKEAWSYDAFLKFKKESDIST